MRSRSQQQSKSPEHDSRSAKSGAQYHDSRTPVSPSGPRVELLHRGSHAINGVSLDMGSAPLDDTLPNKSHMELANGGGTAFPYSSTLDGTGSLRPLPGRARRKRQNRRRKYEQSGSQSFSKRFYARWIKGFATSFSKLFVAVALWYGLGVVSIATSKLLLTQYAAAVPPLCLTLQQLFIGSTLLRFLLRIRFLDSSGLQPCPTSAPPRRHAPRRWNYVSPPTRSLSHSSLSQIVEKVSGGKVTLMHPQLLAAGVFFSLGFLTTNYAFSASAASFVETIKASEPISSALLAHLWQIEILGRPEITSLGTIVVGVAFSTLGNGSSTKTAASSTFQDSLYTCLVVFIANLCFSFRGLYQKLFRASGLVLDDLNLQFRMQQVGVFLLVVPVLLREGSSVLSYWWHHGSHGAALGHFLLLSVVNGLCFTGYNLASTYILSRISVVHHAALNCLRRVFAVVCTSIYFQVPLTWLGMSGIALSTAGFLSFTHYKVQRQRQPKPLSSLLPVSLNEASSVN